MAGSSLQIQVSGKAVKGIRLTAEVSGGALENCRLVGKDYSALSMGLRRFDAMLESRRKIEKIIAAACRMLNVET